MKLSMMQMSISVSLMVTSLTSLFNVSMISYMVNSLSLNEFQKNKVS